MTSPLWMPNIPPAMPNVTAGNPTTLKLGAWNTLTDGFVAHASSPTGAIINLNDGANWSLADTGSNFGEGFDWDVPKPDVYTSTNSRTVGERVTRINYGKARHIKLHLLLGQAANYTTFIGNLRTLIQALQGISPDQPAALQMQITQASTPVYADVLQGHVVTRYKEILYNQLIDDGVEVELLCRPFLRGARQTLQNLVVNPGFEAPSGPGVQAFNDTFATLNAYTSTFGSAPTAPAATTWVDVVEFGTANAPARFLRLGEASGTTAYDIGGTGNAGTSANCTLGSTVLVSGDTGTSYLFNGTSSKVTIPTTGLPTGNAAMAMGEAFRISALPAASSVLMSYGGTALTAHQNIVVYIIPSGKLQCDVSGSTGTITGTTTITLNANHLAEVKWDGTTLTLYLDGVSQGTSTPGAQAIPASPTLTLGSNTNGSSWFTGNLQEFFFYSAADTGQSARWTALSTGATGTQANTMVIPSASRVAFGSPSWGAINAWQVRFRWMSGLTAQFYVHFTDGNNYLRCQIAQGSMVLQHAIGGTVNTLATVTPALTHESWYWVVMTQFPAATGNAPQVQALLYYDNAGVLGSAVTSGTIGPVATQDAVTALLGKPQIMASGAALAMGGTFTNVHVVGLFGPGGWYFAGVNTSTGPAVLGWDGVQQLGASGTTANTYTGGPVVSNGAARIDLAPAGTSDARLSTWDGITAPVVRYGIPTSQGHVLGYSVAMKSSGGLSATSTVQFIVKELNSSGTGLTDGVVTLISGTNPVGWQSYSGAYTIQNATTAYVRTQLRVLDSTANSANATVWFDNVQLWDQTTTGMTSMPYCELRFAQSPAQLLVSGLQGDAPAPAFLGIGTYAPSLGGNSSLNFAIGKRALAGTSATLTTALTASGTTKPILDSSSYGGFYLQQSSSASFATIPGVGLFSTLPDNNGTYHVFTRMLSTGTTGNASKIQAVWVSAAQLPSQTGPGGSNWVLGPQTYPFAAGSTWTSCDLGQIVQPLAPYGALTNFATYPLQTWVMLQDVQSAQFNLNWLTLMPVDATFISGAVVVPQYANLSGWFWIYADALNVEAGATAPIAWTLGYVNNTALPQPATGIHGPSEAAPAVFSVYASIYPYVTPTGDYLTLTPTTVAGSTRGVNQFTALMTDNAGDVLPFYSEITSSPLYLMPQ